MEGKNQELTLDEKLELTFVPEDERPYEVPSSWVWTKLEPLLVEIKNGTTIKQDKSNDGYSVTRIESLQNNTIDFSRLGTIVDETKIKESDWYKENDIALSHINSAEHVGKTALIDANMLPLVHGMNLLRLRFNGAFLPKLFQYYSQSFQYKDSIIKRINMAVNQVSINQKQLGNLELPLPPLAEQQRIVDRIESLFKKLDQAKELAQNALDTFGNRKAAIFHKAFTGELTTKWRKNNGMGMDCWEETTLGNIIRVSSGKSLTAKNMHPEGKVPVYGGNGITGYHNDSNVEANTIVIGRVGFYCGSVHFIDQKAWVTDNALIVKFNANNININFLYHLLSYTDMRSNDSSTAQPVISGSKIYPLKVVMPPLSEQQEIVYILDSIFEKEKKAKELFDVIEKIDLMKKAILARAFRGELGTNDPSEESAVELLKVFL